MVTNDFSSPIHHAGARVVVALIVGAVVTIVVGLAGRWTFAPAVGWIAAALVYLLWTWGVIGRLDEAETSRYATREDRSRVAAEVVLLSSSLASFGAIALILLESSSAKGVTKALLVGLALSTIALSWLMVTTVFTLRYAHLYYSDTPGGISFNQDDHPKYTDFAYLAVTIGATYQVSDTNIETHTIRMTALRHSLLSYLLGVVVLATSINLISGLAH
jgi:uncharacterized membrane protein